MAGVPFSIRPHLVAQGDRTPAPTARLVVDGQPVGERRVDRLRDGRWAVPRFDHAFAAGGWHSGSVEVVDPTMPLDNRRYFAVEVLDSVRVLAVDGAPSQVPRLDELFFLKAALTAASEGKGSLRLDAIGPAALADGDLGPYPLVILANVGAPTPAAVEKLEAFVERGGACWSSSEIRRTRRP
jgi:hypothetical protein